MDDDFQGKDHRNIQKHAGKNHKNVLVEAQISWILQKKEQQREKQQQIEVEKTQIQIGVFEKPKNIKGKRKNRKGSFSSDEADKHTVDETHKNEDQKNDKRNKK